MTGQETSNYRNTEKLGLREINGNQIQNSIVRLASIGGTRIVGTVELPTRYAVSRLALSLDDSVARTHIANEMDKAGMTEVIYTPFGIIGCYKGEYPDLPPVVIESHYDSVTHGGMYDGTVGVIGGIETIRHFAEKDIKPRRSVLVVAQTGEESASFGEGLFGSRGLTRGLSNEILGRKNSDGVTIFQALQRSGQLHNNEIERVSNPYFKRGDIYAVVELHQSQDARLDKTGADLAIVENIAAPHRFKVTIGDILSPVSSEKYDVSDTISVQVAGKAGHSGTTLMGSENRADGFVAISDVITYAAKLQETSSVQIAVGNMSITAQNMNKIPGTTSAHIRVSGSDIQAVNEIKAKIANFIALRNTHYSQKPTQFRDNPIQISLVQPEEARTPFFDPLEVLERHALAGKIAKYINNIANKTIYLNKDNVATVSEFNFNNQSGQIVLSIDMRGGDRQARDTMVTEVTDKLNILREKGKLSYEDLGGGDPVSMDSELVEMASEIIKANNIGTCVITQSLAGHDIQNYARAGHIRAVMIFIPSRNGGIAHTPEEYSTPRDLENGVRALASLVYNLAMETE